MEVIVRVRVRGDVGVICRLAVGDVWFIGLPFAVAEL